MANRLPQVAKRIQVIGDPRITELRIPARSFWVLTRDPFDEASGIFASRGLTQAWRDFLYCFAVRNVEEQLTILKDEGLLNWAGDPCGIPGLWMDGSEYRECLILSC